MRNKSEHKTKPELWKQIEALEQKIMFMEKFLEENGLLLKATEYVENSLLNLEGLPFD